VRRLLIVRHGESEWNREGRWQGWEDIALTPSGEDQARVRGAELRAMGLKLFVVSNWDSSLPSLLARLGIGDAFDDVIVSAVVGASKPDRGIFAEALRRTGVAPGAALHVGDSLVDDYHGARAAGLHALLVDRAGRHGPEVESIASLVELPVRIAGRKTA